MCRSPRLKNKKNPKEHNKEIHEVGSQPAHWWRTGQWTITCPVGHGTVCTERHATRRSRAVAPDCPVCTGQSGNGRIQRSTTIDPNGRLTWPGHRTVNSACPVCTGLSGAPVDRSNNFLSNDYNWGGGYKYPLPTIWRCESTNNIPRYIVYIFKCSNTQVLNRITRWLV